MSYLNLDLDYFNHPKTRRLVGLLGRGAAELPIRLWCYCGKYHAESGSLTGYTDQEIESIVGWWGKANEMVTAMLTVGFLIKDDSGMRINDWSEINGHLAMFRERAKLAAMTRWKCSSNATSNAQASPKQCPNLTNQPNLTKPNSAPARVEVEIPSDLSDWTAPILLWLAYKREKGQAYKPKGLEALWRAIRAIPGPSRASAIDRSMANNWAGIFAEQNGGRNAKAKGHTSETPAGEREFDAARRRSLEQIGAGSSVAEGAGGEPQEN